VPRTIHDNDGTEVIVLGVRVFEEFAGVTQVCHARYARCFSKFSVGDAFLAQKKIKNKEVASVPQFGQNGGVEAGCTCQGSKCARMDTKETRKAYGNESVQGKMGRKASTALE
jgi:hypothetical protein